MIQLHACTQLQLANIESIHASHAASFLNHILLCPSRWMQCLHCLQLASGPPHHPSHHLQHYYYEFFFSIRDLHMLSQQLVRLVITMTIVHVSCCTFSPQMSSPSHVVHHPHDKRDKLLICQALTCMNDQRWRSKYFFFQNHGYTTWKPIIAECSANGALGNNTIYRV